MNKLFLLVSISALVACPLFAEEPADQAPHGQEVSDVAKQKDVGHHGTEVREVAKKQGEAKKTKKSAKPKPPAEAVKKGNAGDEHAGQEHGGQEIKKKEEKKTEEKPESRLYGPDEIKSALTASIQSKTAADGGSFRFNDPDRANRAMTLQFVKIHDPVRKLADGGYFACTDFQVVGGPAGQLHDVDFWLKPGPDGVLQVTETKVHKDPVLVGGRWEKQPRYTFIGDKPVVLGVSQ